MLIEFIIEIAATTVKFAAYVLASLVAVVVGSCLLFALRLSYHGIAHAVHSERSLWYHAGRASVWIQAGVRHPHAVLVALTVAEVASELNRVVDSIADDLSDERSGNPPPEVPPIQADNLRMPTTYPFKRVRTLSWPPFVGHRFALGDRGV